MQCCWFLKFSLPGTGVQGINWPGIFGAIYPGWCKVPALFQVARCCYACAWPQSKVLRAGSRSWSELVSEAGVVACLCHCRNFITDHIPFLYSSDRLILPHCISSMTSLGQCLL